MSCSGWERDCLCGMSALSVVRCIGIVISFIHLLVAQSGNLASVAMVPQPGWAGCWGWKVGSKDGCPGWNSIFWEIIWLGCCIKTDGVDLWGRSFLCTEVEKCTRHRSKPHSPNQKQDAAMIKAPRPVRELTTLIFYNWFSSWQSSFSFHFSPSLSHAIV